MNILTAINNCNPVNTATDAAFVQSELLRKGAA